MRREACARHPRFGVAVTADTRFTAAMRGDRHEYRSRLDTTLQVVRLCLVSDAFFAQLCYRAKAATQARGVPLVPRLLHRLAIVSGQISIGDPVVVRPGVCIPHGQVVVDGLTEIGSRVVLFPFTNIGLLEGVIQGPTIEPQVTIGTGAKVLGSVRIGRAARIGANAVVLDDVPPRATAVGVPARTLGGTPS